MSDKKYKYTFFLKNGNKIVLTDDVTIPANTISKSLSSKKIVSIRTNSDLLLFKPDELSAIHMSALHKIIDDKLEIELESNSTEIPQEESEEIILTDNSQNNIIYDDEYEDDIDINLFNSDSFLKGFGTDIETEETEEIIETE